MELRVGGSALPPHPLKMVENTARVRKVAVQIQWPEVAMTANAVLLNTVEPLLIQFDFFTGPERNFWPNHRIGGSNN